MRGASAGVKARSLELRREMTLAEISLWNALRAGRLNGLKFRRQHPVGKFILDFYCSFCKLVVEVDGAVHEAQAEHDAERTLFLNQYGYHVIRFTNDEVLKDLPAVLEAIVQAASSRR